jgi:tRNA modification GTPase
VRVSGPKTRAVVGSVFESNPPASKPRRGYLTVGSLRLSGLHSPLPATLYFFPGPRSYTGQDLAELHTISSPPLVERLVADLLNAGARSAQPGEFTLRAFLAGKKDLPRAEAVHAVIEADTDAELRTALAQLAGGVSQPLSLLRADLLNLLADLEAALDFAEEDIEFVGKSETLARIGAAADQLASVLRQLDERTISGRPVRVALVGLPNAGKSSLFNALAGGDAIVSPIPGTTRDYLTKRLELGGVAVELIDTAGWQDSSDTIEEQAQQLGHDAASRADVILWCDEAGEFAADDAARLTATAAEVIRVRTKVDLPQKPTPPAPFPSMEGGAESFSPRAIGDGCCFSSVLGPTGTTALREELTDRVVSLARPSLSLAPSQSRCRHHIARCLEDLHAAQAHIARDDPPEVAAAALRAAVDQLGEVTGAVYTNDLLDRIFTRFCIGK